MLMSVPVIPVRMEDRAVIMSMDITVAANQDSDGSRCEIGNCLFIMPSGRSICTA